MFCFIFIGIGFCSKDLLIKTGDAVLGFINGNSSISYRIDKIKNRINATYQKDLFYHKYMLDINSLKENLLGTRVIFKDDTTIVKADSGSLAEPKPKMKESEFKNVISELKKHYADKLFETTISRNVKLSEAPGFGVPVYYHDKRSKGAEEYLSVAKELMQRI